MAGGTNRIVELVPPRLMHRSVETLSAAVRLVVEFPRFSGQQRIQRTRGDVLDPQGSRGPLRPPTE
jgi:hypothetical protein